MLFDRVRPPLQLITLKHIFVSLLFVFQSAPHPQALRKHLRFERAIRLPAATGQACAVLDAPVFAHASPSLKDLRIYSGNSEESHPEIPYAITLSEPLQQETDDARVLNLGTRSGHIVFDLAMPHRPYTAVALDLAAHDFLATANVSGSQTLAASNSTSLGKFTLFDLTSQHLSHNTTLPLSEASFPYLHVELSLAAAPGITNPGATSTGTANSATALNRPETVRAVSVPPSREAQTLYTNLQQTSTLIQRGHETVATFQLPARVPIERIAFAISPDYKRSFSRPVRIEARAIPRQAIHSSESVDNAEAIAEDTAEYNGASSTETASGSILSVHQLEAGRDISYERVSFPVAIGANMQHLADLQVVIENGDDTPLPIVAVQLQMRQRRICFDADSATNPALGLYYGDSKLDAPVYDYAKLFLPAAAPILATLAPESPNHAYIPRTDARPFTERHPELLWVVLLAVVCILALTAFRSAKRLPQ